MSFPNKVYGSFGDEKTTNSTQQVPLGTPMELPDGRLYRYARAGGTTLVAGKLVSQMQELDSERDVELDPAAAAVGASSVTLTMGGTALIADDYADGYLFINDLQGEGEVYKIKSCASAAASSSAVFTFADGDTLKTALKASSSDCGLAHSEYRDVELYPSATTTAMPVGVPPVAVTATEYFWCQRRGACNAFTAATLGATGAAAVPDIATDGAFKAYNDATSGTTEWDGVPVGRWMITAATAGDFGLLYLELE